MRKSGKDDGRFVPFPAKQKNFLKNTLILTGTGLHLYGVRYLLREGALNVNKKEYEKRDMWAPKISQECGTVNVSNNIMYLPLTR
jgi:hypothetical protein